MELAKALSKFHASVGKIAKTANNPFFKSKYAPLPEILEAIAEPLLQSNLVFSQIPDGDCLCTILMHTESGEWISGCYSMHPVKNDPQSIGSAITYARRYALGAILGLNIDKDDDGNQGSGKTPNKPQEKPPVAPPASEKPAITERSFKLLHDRITAGEYDAYEKAKNAFTLTEEQDKELKSLLP